MTAYLIYIIKWAIALTVLYSLFGIFLRKETFHGLNRFVLIAILVGGMGLPLCHLPGTNSLSEVVQQVEQSVSQEAQKLSTPATPHPSIVQVHPVQSPSLWFVAMVGIYLIGLLISWARYIKAYIALWIIIKNGSRLRHENLPEHVHLIANENVCIPCSWMRWIIMGPADLEKDATLFIRHELAHIHKGHSWDMLLCDFTVNMLWFLPFAYMLRTDLSDVHEYQADKAVLDCTPDMALYQRMLISKTCVSARSPIVNSFNASALKKRLYMMYCKQSHQLARMKVLYVVPLTVIVVMGYAKPSIIQEAREVLTVEEQKVVSLVEEVIAPITRQPEVPDNPTAKELPTPNTKAEEDITPYAEATGDTTSTSAPSDTKVLDATPPHTEIAEDGLPIIYDLPLNTNPKFQYIGIWIERRENDCLVHYVYTFEENEEKIYLGGDDSYILDSETNTYYKCRGSLNAVPFNTEFHVRGMKGKTVDLALVFPSLPTEYQMFTFLSLGAHKKRSYLTKYELCE